MRGTSFAEQFGNLLLARAEDGRGWAGRFPISVEGGEGLCALWWCKHGRWIMDQMDGGGEALGVL